MQWSHDTLLLSTQVNLGKNGLGWGLGENILVQKNAEPLKYEGDKRAPMGVFKLTHIFGYGFLQNTQLPYLHSSKNLICVDEAGHNFYNQVIEKSGDEKSFERMRRKDTQYKYGIVVAHNQKGIEKRGSCIFLHLQDDADPATTGCTSMHEDVLKQIIHLLDKEKNPLLVQVPKSKYKEVLQHYPQLQKSQLLTQ